jgi:predicted ABC-type ATPase
MRKAKKHGFRVYLYFISLDNPNMNIGRVKTRVEQGGHDVPEDKIRERYQRTMDQLLDAIKLADKSFIFDNSYSEPKLFAISNNDELEIIDTEFIPSWFQTNVLSKLESSNP